MSPGLFAMSVFLAASVSSHTVAEESQRKSVTGCEKRFVPSQLDKQGLRCDGREIVVRGYLRVGSEMRGLWDSMEDIEQANFRNACVTLTFPRGLGNPGGVRRVDVFGTYHATRQEGLIILGACNEPYIEVDRISDVE